MTNIVSSTNSVAVSSFAYRYNDANQRTGVTNVDGSYWVYGYDSLGQVVSGKKYWADNSAVAGQQFEYGFDDIGNRKTNRFGGDNSGANLHTATYGANLLNQYTNRTVPGYIQMLGTAVTNATMKMWGYEPDIGWSTTQTATPSRHSDYFCGEVDFDNTTAPLLLYLERLGLVASGGVSNVAVASGTSFLPQTPEVFRYDGDGNLTNDGHWIYTWDAENRLVKMLPLSTVTDSGKAELIFAYDYQGRRLRKDVYGYYWYGYALASRFNFVYDGWNVIAELNYWNSILRKYLWGLDLSGSPQGAGGVGGLLDIADTANGIHFVAYDGNGNVASLTSATNSVVAGKYEYGPFGEVLRKTGIEAGASPLRFSTKYQDDETDLLYYGYRYYGASTARWVSRDPIGELKEPNLYEFCKNVPPLEVDRLGQECCLLTWPASSSGGFSLAGHSALSCDDGTYVSFWPSKKEGPWHTNELQDIQWENGRPPDRVCFDCLTNSQVQAWLQQAKARDMQWCVGNNCADAVGSAIGAGLPEPQEHPVCPCSVDRFTVWAEQDLLDPGAGIALPSGLKGRVDQLKDNKCNRYKCILKNRSTGGRATPSGT